MASKEMYLGRHYIKKEKWIAAINRFKTVINDYQTTIYVEEAIHRVVEIYYRIGLVEESKKYATLLGYNYQSGQWYSASYKLFNKKQRQPQIKKNKKGLIKTFKILFD
jgi:outer membrane protein assembly factor BamD